MTRARPLSPILALAAALAGLAGCSNIGPRAHGEFHAPMVQIVPGVSAPSAPVMTVLRTKQVSPPPPQPVTEDPMMPAPAVPAALPPPVAITPAAPAPAVPAVPREPRG